MGPHVLDQLDGYVDDELLADEAIAVGEHLSECGTCSESYEALIALRVRIQEGGLGMEAPPRVHAAVRDAIRRALDPRSELIPVPAQPRTRWRSRAALSIAATIAVVLASAGSLGILRAARAKSAAEADAVLTSHIRSLMADHLTDVLSTDQHTVKPWFTGKLDFSPTVSNFDQQGFPLAGGRLDYIAGHPVAALVYHRRAHVINEFLWPASGGSNTSVDEREQRGYTILHWRGEEMEHWVVSDVSRGDLATFAALVRGADSAAAVSR